MVGESVVWPLRVRPWSLVWRQRAVLNAPKTASKPPDAPQAQTKDQGPRSRYQGPSTKDQGQRRSRQTKDSAFLAFVVFQSFVALAK